MDGQEAISAETTRLTADLIETVRCIDRAGIDALGDPARRVTLSSELSCLWLKTRDIGARLKELGGLPLMYRVVREVRRASSRMCDALEDSWSARVPGYQKMKWLP